MIADAMTSIKAYLYEKSTSPLLGSLVISWCAWNYKFLLMLVSGLSFPDKLRYINILYSNTYECFFQGMLLPVLTSILYLFAFPYPAQYVYEFSLGKQKALNELKNKIQENELLTVEQSRAIRNQLLDTENHFEGVIERKDRALEAKDKVIAELEQSLQKLNDELKIIRNSGQTDKTLVPPVKQSLEDKVILWIGIGRVSSPRTEDEYYSTILCSLYQSGGRLSKSSVLNMFRDKTKATYYLDDMLQKDYLNYDALNMNYSMSHKMKGLFVANT